MAMASNGQTSSHDSSPSHPRHAPSRKSTKNSTISFMQQPESLILPDGAIGADAAELLEEFVHPHHPGRAYLTETTLVESDTSAGDESDNNSRKEVKSPWWKKPSPWWLLMLMPFTAIATSATIAPRIEMYTILACKTHRPDIFREVYPDYDMQGLASALSRSSDQVGPTYASNSSSVLSALSEVSFLSTDTWTDGIENMSRRPIKKNKCAADPTVAAAVAKLTAVISTWMGTLSILTTGWWGAFSDRYGRTRVMGIFILSLLFADLMFIMVAKISHRLPGGYWFLVIGPSLEGLLGGSATAMAASHGYLADSTTETTRTRVFSLYLGFHFTGMSLGSAIGSLLIRYTGHILSVFYLATILHLIYTILVWTVVPESLTQEQMDEAKENYADELLESSNNHNRNPASIRIIPYIKRLFSFLSPLAVFKPTVTKPGQNPLAKPKKDYNLALVAIAYGATISLMGSNSYKYQYAESTFGWKTTTVGYWVSLTGVTRALFLTVVLPVIIKILKPEPAQIRLPADPNETTPLIRGASNGKRTRRSISSSRVMRHREVHSPAFDLGLARASLAVEIVGYAMMGLAPVGWMFMLFGVVGSFGTGFSPAVQSVILSLYASRGGTEIGRLYGALSVIQALCSQIVGPSVYAFAFVKTFGIFPPAIFFISAFCVTTSFVMLSFVRIPKEEGLQPFASVTESGATSEL
ncbi:putative membrane protein C14C4.07 [Psilocybe cubensis]|uniref:Major facilitator superfamily (MFS) profile domain-containing protein n=2 Tax=Psilocybe cubensis TaxID=181762 RepID=A0A8H7Y1M2_PSICU|nr:putative membrane protein C14C4.07 [Psilocybe cubensis]KAH9484437.1 putative membrane protein C14C4.07 [Psilocybe cubensis]